MHQVNGTIDSYFNVQFEDGGNLDIINIPSQHVNGMLEHRATDARLRWAATIRKDLKYTESLDREVLRGATKGRDMEEARILKHYMSLASWDNDKLYDAGQVDSRECELCGHHTRTHEHLMKYCPALKQERAEADDLCVGFCMNDMPHHLSMGLPPVMSACIEDTFWGTPWRQLAKLTEAMGCFSAGIKISKTARDALLHLILALLLHKLLTNLRVLSKLPF